MPSQRLLTMLDPRGHLGAGGFDRVIGARTRTNVAVCFVGKSLRPWVAAQMTEAGVTPLVATSFRHVTTSMHANAAPHAQIAILDFDVLGAGDISELITQRWLGYRGSVIALARSGVVDARTVQLATIERVVKPTGSDLRDCLANVAVRS